MFKFLRHNYIYYMVVFTILYNELFFALLLSRGAFAESGIKQYEAIIYSVLVYPVLLRDLFQGRFDKYSLRILFFLIIILILYLLTSFIYGNPQAKYYTFLLEYGAECITAAFLGMRFAQANDKEKINKLIPFVVFPSTLLIGTIGLRTALMGEIVHEYQEESGGLNYQAVSYYMSYAYAYCSYLCFFAKMEKSLFTKCIRILSLLLLLFSAVTCLMGGGRGAFVLLVLITILELFYYIKHTGIGVLGITTLLGSLFLLVLGMISYFGIMESAGMERVLNNLTNAGEREELYNSAYDAFVSSPILGNGVGSVWWKVGFYCHNMLLDFLVEVGLFGTIFFIVLLMKSFWRYCKWSINSQIFLLLLLIYVCALVEGTFSGYWIGSMKLFFVCSFAFCYKHRFSTHHPRNFNHICKCR